MMAYTKSLNLWSLPSAPPSPPNPTICGAIFATCRGKGAMLSEVPARRRVGPKTEQNSGEVKLKLPEDASKPMGWVLRAMRVRLSASRYLVGFDGMDFAY